MTPGFTVILAIHNSLHDAATAIPAAGAATLWLILRQAPADGGEGSIALLQHVCRSISVLMKYSLAWISIGAIPRLLAFSSTEWQQACDRGHSAGLLMKNIVVLLVLLAGVLLWIMTARKMKSMGLSSGHGEEPR